MKFFLVAITLFFSQFVLASDPPDGYPIVNGVVRKVDTSAGRISIKHDAIPNLDMPGMTMSFLASNPDMLEGLKANDKIHFVADEIDGELTVLWIEKVSPSEIDGLKILCRGIAKTHPVTNVEIEIRPIRFSTIRYEFAEGSLKGTAYVNSIGIMKLHKRGDFYIYRSGVRELDSRLYFKIVDDKIADACFFNKSANMVNSPVECEWVN